LVDQRPSTSYDSLYSTNYIIKPFYYQNPSRRRKRRVAVANLATAISPFKLSPILDQINNFIHNNNFESFLIQYSKSYGRIFRPKINHYGINDRGGRRRAARSVAASSPIRATTEKINCNNNYISSSITFTANPCPQIKRICRTQNESCFVAGSGCVARVQTAAHTDPSLYHRPLLAFQGSMGLDHFTFGYLYSSFYSLCCSISPRRGLIFSFLG
jgi:hypothetical protein